MGRMGCLLSQPCLPAHYYESDYVLFLRLEDTFLSKLLLTPDSFRDSNFMFFFPFH